MIVTGEACITQKQDLSRWTRAHADSPGINWLTARGPSGSMVIREFDCDRRDLLPAGQETSTPEPPARVPARPPSSAPWLCPASPAASTA